MDKSDAEYDRPDGKGFKDHSNFPKSKPFGNDGGEFNKLYDHVEQKVPGNKEEHRIHPETIPDDGVDDVPPATKIQEDCAGIKDIGKEAI